ncbi:hypothetical protein VA596_50015 [Amycolatopsis sp., V23-08]|uniref:Uncharacterized protein n=1 Tax=Amycolatopsis heterodermiae TaxID=3110235 RepID=A0ABU5RN86_9PSEU|nr:hypothetical protein [Amycolatopsis sp., V23-08]MEA5367748.1 hypothetical protein [Amycolatopsis sp., V23-08]
MSYVFSRDNPEIADRLAGTDLERIRAVSDRIDRIHAEGMHQDLCGCTAATCTTRTDVELREAGSEETIAWLAALGFVSIDELYVETR